MTICKFFQSGYCRNGNSCRFEHTNPNANRFSSFNNTGGGGGFSNASGSDAFGRDRELPFALGKEQLLRDLTEEKPQWILSAYGPGRDAPEQLFGGFPREQSYEEIRLAYLEGLMAGNPQAALSQIEGLYRDADAQIQNAVNNIDGALQFILDAQHKTPNRNSVLQNNTNGTFAAGRQQQPSNPFGAAMNQQASAFGGGGGGFGQPSALGQKPNLFGGPPAQSASVFGQPSLSTSGFGQPTALGTGGSAFGQPSALGSAAPGFGQPSMMGQRQNAFGAPAFGQSNQMSGGASAAFGQPSALGPKPSPFGGSAGAVTGPFGSMLGSNLSSSPFGLAAGGQTNNTSPFRAPTTAGSTFGQPSAPGGGVGFGSVGQTPNPFGQAGASSTTPFGQQQPTAQTPNPFSATPTAQDQPMDMAMALATPTPGAGFGAPSVVGSATAPSASNPFQQTAPATASAFGQMNSTPASNPFAAANPSQPAAVGAGASPYGSSSTRQHPPASSYIVKNPDGTLRSFKGKGVGYQAPREGHNGGKAFPVLRNFDGSFVRIWNPEGAPAYYRDTEPPGGQDVYDSKTKDAYQVFVRTGRFEGGVLPEVPPLREWCTWDF